MKFQPSGLWTAVLGVAITAAVPQAFATTTYTYTGNDFTSVSGGYTTSESVSGSITLATPLAANLTSYTTVVPTAFDFTDGVNTITNTTPGEGSQFFFKTDASGNITFWGTTVDIGSAYQFSISTVNAPGTYGVFDSSQVNGGISQGEVVNSPGKWSKASAVPEPATQALFVAGIALMGAGLRVQRNQG